MKQLALIGSTASGKSDLALKLAEKYNALILSIDSLSIYKEIDIASAKPTKGELAKIEHFGVDRLNPDENASVMTFIDEYNRICDQAILNDKNVIIVGGSSFYLKSMIEGLSEIPDFSSDTLLKTKEMLCDLSECHKLLSSVDPISMGKIAPSDAYRIEKMLLIYLETQTAPSEWFRTNPPSPIITECPVLHLDIDRTLLRDRIALRTRKMVDAGLIDEVAELERKYGRVPNSMKAIGIIETLEYLDGKISKPELIELVSIHTGQLAKRQQTFNIHQFTLRASASSHELENIADSILKQR
ncbi:tRNA delta(2)-isopentenylpyrophosphate transferase [Sulfuricurvum kujiense DSM 16994]|uniref:tRNA dimethylallyltransferase n=1 Tax=Sulfuricurvum kujiense (strain ATCC BAA-921 / DSM 16994 / JCM 11577 / YK-1) TaxID=709032 RepID=E4TYH0_SULKY|nr:tRNA (adenosine(37)-N6)-dimethylallyltransferase MiaA [Sulfuricurvum kujiense]ADR32947.1 tRNA delta(2)-isopentenylpyrophosphate transferase [Sulfuricurvum kujiense DSM 16994]